MGGMDHVVTKGIEKLFAKRVVVLVPVALEPAPIVVAVFKVLAYVCVWRRMVLMEFCSLCVTHAAVAVCESSADFEELGGRDAPRSHVREYLPTIAGSLEANSCLHLYLFCPSFFCTV
jgi:hypothetical protein